MLLHSDKPYSQFKPGQTTLDRDYYKDATKEAPSGGNCLQNYQRFGSDYSKGVSGAVQPGDYKVPSKDANNLIDYELMNKPSLFAYTRRAKYDDPAKTNTILAKAGEGSLGDTTKHWKTNS